MAENFADWLSSQTEHSNGEIAKLAAKMADFPAASDGRIHEIRLWLVDRSEGADGFDALDRAVRLWGLSRLGQQNHL